MATTLGVWSVSHWTTREVALHSKMWPELLSSAQEPHTARGCPIRAAAAKSLQSCLKLTLCNPIDGSPPGSAVPGILQARTLEWIATAFSNA